MKTVRTTLGLLVSTALLSAVAMAGVSGNAAKKDNQDQKQHHSRLAKAAFWRHHKKDKDSAKPQAQQSHAKKASIVAAKNSSQPVKQASSKHVQKTTHVNKVSKSQAKASTHKVASAQKTSKTAPKQNVASVHKAVKHHTTAKKSKPQEKAQPRTTASLNR